MKLANCEILPGVVVDANDPKKMGRIKAVVPGLFDNSTMDVEDMFWVIPFSCNGYQRVSKPMEGQKVWVLQDPSNEYEYYYIPRWESNTNTVVAQQDDDYDVLVSRSGEVAGQQMYYSMQQGFVTRIGQIASTTMSQDGNIENLSNGVEVSIKSSKVYCGTKDQASHPMVLGDELYTLLGNLESGLNKTKQLAQANMYTSTLVPGLEACEKAIANILEKIKSDTCFVSK